MKLMFLLSGENLDLAREEVLALAQAKDNKYEQDENILILETEKERLQSRLSFTHKIYKYLFKCNEKDLEKSMKEYNWQKIYRESYVIRTIGDIKQKEKDLAGFIWDNLKKPKVSLKYAMTNIELIKVKNKIYCGLLHKEISKEFHKRKAHMRPELHPTSLSPKLARAMINLTGIEKGTVVDPFCGTGGILIEAGLMNFVSIGYDINKLMLKKAKNNLDSLGVRYYNLEHGDATKITKISHYIITDLPYGRNSQTTDKIEDLYADFMKVVENTLKFKAVIVFPDNVDYKSIIKKTKLKITNVFTIYLHKSLSKKIVVLEL
ncbi:DNA methyltransferase [Nanoarchaeota archaeon]